MRVWVVLALVAVLGAAPARAQITTSDIVQALGPAAGETHYLRLPGPTPGETRGLAYWRPPNVAPDAPLPVIYVADGLLGMAMLAPQMRQSIVDGRMAPAMVVSIDPDPRHRTEEYVAHVPGSRFAQTDRWFVGAVMAWAEQHAGASQARQARAVAGFSNGADFALEAARRHPDLFGAVIAHSPAATRLWTLAADTPPMRWVVTASYTELQGEPFRISHSVVAEIARHPHQEVRTCYGDWEHQFTDWRALSLGAAAFALGLADPAGLQSDREAASCQMVQRQ